jgi:hypothetical protein
MLSYMIVDLTITIYQERKREIKRERERRERIKPLW